MQEKLTSSNNITFWQSVRRYLAFYIDSLVSSLIIMLLTYSIFELILIFVNDSTYTIYLLPTLIFFLLKMANPLPSFLTLIILFFSFSVNFIKFVSVEDWSTLVLFWATLVLLFLAIVAIITLLDTLIQAGIVYFFSNSFGKKLFRLKINSLDNSQLVFSRLFKRFFKRNITLLLIGLLAPLLIISSVIAYFFKKPPNFNYQSMINFVPLIYILSLWFIICLVYLYLNNRKNNTYWDKSANTIVRY